jgi:AhpD family alkylhydroperoxidase
MSGAEEFRNERDRLNAIVMKHADLTTKRFFALDTAAYSPSALDARTKELLGLVSSLVLRCDDCVKYHLIRCREEGITTPELTEALSIGLVVGGSIVIPHLRRAFDFWEELGHSSTRSE